MLKFLAVFFLVALSAAQVSDGAEQKPPDSSAPVKRRGWGLGRHRHKESRKSLPAFLHSLTLSENGTIYLNPDKVRAEPDQSQAVSPPAWKDVARCLATLERRGVETMAGILCADDPDLEACIAEFKEWVLLKRVASVSFVSIHVGHTERHRDKSVPGSFKFFAPLPTTLARINRLSDICVALQKAPKTYRTKDFFVQSCLALIFYHPSAAAAWAEHLGLPQSQMYTLYWRMFFPLWHKFAFTSYLMSKHPYPMELLSSIRGSDTKLLQPITHSHSTPATLVTDGIKDYLFQLDKSLKLHGGPLDLTIEECAARMAFWVVDAHCTSGGLQ